MLDYMISRRRALHRIPELGYELPETQNMLRAALREFDCKLEEVAGSGLLAWFDFGKAETAAFRADMDALPIQENTGLPFASAHPGKMHACGHDAHMAMLLGLSKWAGENPSLPGRNLLMIFQPAEEGGAGGKAIAESGALERYGVTRVYAHHVDPFLPLGCVGSRPGPLMAMTCEFFVDVRGLSAHAAQAEKGVDALYAAANFLLKSREMERNLPPELLRLLHIGSLHGGEAANIVADEAKLHGTLRAFSKEEHEALKNRLRAIAQSISDQTGAQFSLRFDDGYPPVVNDPALYREAEEALKGIPFLTIPAPSMLAEDFSFYMERVPGLLMKVGLGTGIALHSANFNFDERALLAGFEAFRRLAML